MTAPAIGLSAVSFSYTGPLVLDRVSLEIAEGEFVGLVGPNAGGKSTLLKIILGLLDPTAGRVEVLGRAPREARRHLGYVPQHPTFARDFPVTVEQIVLMGRLSGMRPFGRFSAADRAVAQRCMQETEVHDLARRQPFTLSGGQLQRVLIARALACEPRILILDEPTANIDARMEGEIFDLLRQINRRLTILVVSHDVAFISGYIQRVACLNRTLVCHPTTPLDSHLIEALYQSPVRRVQHAHP
jgi:zinc transport system ATP-binding protein